MKRSKFIALFLFCTSAKALFAQSTVTYDFNNLLTSPDTFMNGSAGDTAWLVNDALTLPVRYDTVFDYWASGFAISNKTDTFDGNFTNLYSAYTISPDADNGYIVANLAEGPINIINYVSIPLEGAIQWNSVMIANTTYAYKSMTFGNLFAKKFGGPSGNDPDYFFVRFSDDNTFIDAYLADYRFSNNQDDYILDDWLSVDLRILNPFKITVELFSSDTGAFGINTPLFFALDNLSYDFSTGIQTLKNKDWNCWSNGIGILINASTIGRLNVFNVQGQLIFQKQVQPGISEIDIPKQNGILMLQWQSENGSISSQKLFH
jgi:hypothetical protein